MGGALTLLVCFSWLALTSATSARAGAADLMLAQRNARLESSGQLLVPASSSTALSLARRSAYTQSTVKVPPLPPPPYACV